MEHSNYQQSWNFNFEGRFLGFWGDKPGKLKYLQLGFSQEQVQIKLPKDLQTSLRLILQPGDRIQVLGRGQLDHTTGELKLKAHRVTSLAIQTESSLDYPSCSWPQNLSQIPPTVKARSAPTKAKILVCQKSKCWQRGGKQLLRSLEKALSDRNLQTQIKVERTGCMKCCSSAPNFMIMPGKHRYRQVRPENIPALLAEHYGHL
ncbi:MAG: (2Fe-2S) ferredoxin domain-containing protein [Cyanothece sp. SIO1E1]|nr:(2Fe-2S) ferredoxin domain-containing protein [Cyanothece sp. SIO1E1]